MGLIQEKVMEVQLRRLHDTLTNFQKISELGQIWWGNKLAYLYSARQAPNISRLIYWTRDNRVFITTGEAYPRYMEITVLFR